MSEIDRQDREGIPDRRSPSSDAQTEVAEGRATLFTLSTLRTKCPMGDKVRRLKLKCITVKASKSNCRTDVVLDGTGSRRWECCKLEVSMGYKQTPIQNSSSNSTNEQSKQH